MGRITDDLDDATSSKYGEPWVQAPDYPECVNRADGLGIAEFTSEEKAKRAVVCVNALAGGENPEKAVETLKHCLRGALAELRASDGYRVAKLIREELNNAGVTL